MIKQDYLDILRCPLDPNRAKLILDGDRLICERCALGFTIKDDFPNLIVEEAILPKGCESVDQLPCQQTKNPPRAAGLDQ